MTWHAVSTNIFFIVVSKEQVEEGKALLNDTWEGLKNIKICIQTKHLFQSEDGNNNLKNILVF